MRLPGEPATIRNTSTTGTACGNVAKKNEIGIHSIRGGTIVGEHEVIFAGTDEIITLSHSARSKDVFAVGAFKAAKYIKGRAPGLYDMKNLIEDS